MLWLQNALPPKTVSRRHSNNVARAALPRNLVTCAIFLPAQEVVAHGAEDLAVRLWDARDGFFDPTVTLSDYVYFPLCIDALSNGVPLLLTPGSKGFSGNGCEGKVWDLRSTDSPVAIFKGHERDVVGCSLLTDTLAVTASKDGSVRLWNVSSSACVYVDRTCQRDTSIPSSLDVVDAPDARYVVVATHQGIFYAYSIDESAQSLTLAARSA